MKLPLNFGGAGGSGSDDCTATASEVLEGVTAIYNGSDDEPAEGGLKDYSDASRSATASLDTSNSRFQMTVPALGKYNTGSKLYDSYSDIASLINLGASKIATGSSILGVSGSYTGLGDATTSQVLAGKTFSNASSSNLTGTMTNVAATETAKSVGYSSGTVYLRMTNGAHINKASSGYPEVTADQADVASAISLTADKIITNNSILGVTGTAVSIVSGSPSSGDLYYYGQRVNSISYSSSSVFTYTQYGSLVYGPGYLGVSVNGYTSSSIGSLTFGFASQVDLSNYSTVHARIQPILYDPTTNSSSDSRYWNETSVRFVYSTASPTSTGTNPSYISKSLTPSVSDNAFAVQSLTWDVSSLTNSYYVGFRFYNNSASSNTVRAFIIDRIWLT